MRKATMALLTVVIALQAYKIMAAPEPFDDCRVLFPGGSVPDARSDTVTDLCKTIGSQPIFAVRFDTSRKIPNWTAHSLSPAQKAMIDDNAGQMSRPKFKPGPGVPRDQQAKNSSYTNSGYQRGHMVPAGDMSWNAAAYKATFTFTNAAPQLGKLNNGTWRGLEDRFRNLVAAKDVPMWVISGSYGSVGTIGAPPNSAEVPRCFYKIIIASENGGKSFQALTTLFEWDDERRRKDWTRAVTTLDQVRVRTGIDFLGGLDLEPGFDAAFWGVDMPSVPADCV